MEARELLEAIQIAERLNDATRHCYTKNGRHESVAEHSWMMTLMVSIKLLYTMIMVKLSLAQF